ncbi:MAG TPA: hypothetical protein VJ302_26905 [Blastocatellia bacterium]|nr:hypothetical protein [Blastocatellia bacterium]
MKPGIYPQTIGKFLLHSGWMPHTGDYALYQHNGTRGFVLRADLEAGKRQVRGADRRPDEERILRLQPTEAVIYSEENHNAQTS